MKVILAQVVERQTSVDGHQFESRNEPGSSLYPVHKGINF